MAAGAPHRTKQGSSIDNDPSAGLQMHITKFLYWIEASSSPQNQRKCLKFPFEIKSDKTKSLDNNFYK